MQAEWRAIAVATQSLITETGRNPVCPEKCRQQMTLRIAIATALLKHVGRRTRDGHQPEVVGVLDFVPDPLETLERHLVRIRQAGTQSPRPRLNSSVQPIVD